MIWRIRFFVTDLLVVLLAYDFYLLTQLGGWPGSDYRMYMVIADRVLSGGPLYMPYQTAGSYVTMPGDSMYPPIAFPLFAAFRFLPALLWWIVPLGITAWAIWQMHPSRTRWIMVLALVAWPSSLALIWTGNPGVWTLAAISLGVLYRWPFALVLLKPSLFPLALFGISDRRWWLACVVLGLASLTVLPLTLEWLAVILNARGTWSGWLYALPSVPLMLVPIAAGWSPPRKRPETAAEKAARKVAEEGQRLTPEDRRRLDQSPATS